MKKAKMDNGEKSPNGKLTKICDAPKLTSREGQHAVFDCECGEQYVGAICDVVAGRVKSCGCLSHGPKPDANGRKSGYTNWKQMRTRCRNDITYLSQNIKCCERWDSFDNFYADMGPKPTEKHTLDRIDNTKGYEPTNCRWATWKEQHANRRKNVIRNKMFKKEDVVIAAVVSAVGTLAILSLVFSIICRAIAK